MPNYTLQWLLTSDSRFTKPNSKLQKIAQHISNVIVEKNPFLEYTEHSGKKQFVYYLNLLLLADSQGDSLLDDRPTYDDILAIIKGEHQLPEFEGCNPTTISKLISKPISALSIDFEDDISSKTHLEKSKQEIFLENLTKNQDVNPTVDVKVHSGDSDSNYWVQAVRLDFPMIPQPDATKIFKGETIQGHPYCIYEQSTLPWNQSQITALTDVNMFSDVDVLRLFPTLRLYTRNQYMYQEYKGLEYDEDLGIILKIKGYNKNQIKRNILEYPHLMFLDRSVKIKGKDATLPFWKHIEIDGEIHPTNQIWDELPDTKQLPKTESFMNEYVVRKYLLDRDIKGITHKYPMRGELDSFLTLYAPPEYYESHGYDPLEIGRLCIQARQRFKVSRNPILAAFENAEMSLQ